MPARYGRTGERTRDAQPSTKPCQHETHVHTLAPHTHCVDTARHLMANSSCTVWLAAAERLLGRLTPQHALGRLTSQHALGRLTSQYALGRLTPQHALGRLTPQHAFSLHAVSLGILISIRSQVPRSQASFASPLAGEGPLHSLTSPSLASSTTQHLAGLAARRIVIGLVSGLRASGQRLRLFHLMPLLVPLLEDHQVLLTLLSLEELGVVPGRLPLRAP